jgi:NAD(P)H-dependent FMN reductase
MGGEVADEARMSDGAWHTAPVASKKSSAGFNPTFLNDPAIYGKPSRGRMPDRILVFYGSYRRDRMGIRLADFIVAGFSARGAEVELIDAKVLALPMLDRMYKEYPAGSALPALEELAQKIKAADAFVFVTGEYNWGMQPGLKNLTDHFLEEWFWRPAAVASYSAGRIAGARAALAWHGTLSEMGMVVVSSTLAVGPIAEALDEQAKPLGDAGRALERAFPRFADDLTWWLAAAKFQRAHKDPPY